MNGKHQALSLKAARIKLTTRMPWLPAWIGLLALSLFFADGLRAEVLPPDLAQVLKTFRADGPKGWSFTQVTKAGTETLIEHFDPTEPDFNRWSLTQKDGRAPTASELETYHEGKTRRSSGNTAPRLQDQIDPASATLVRTGDERAVWLFHLTPGGFDDRTARFMVVTITFHLPTQTIERIEIASTNSFSPVLGVKIVSTKTRMDYSLPAGDQPSLLLQVALQVRGRAFWVKSLDQDMTVTYSDYRFRFKK